jgi:hypothetical protein
MSMIVRKEKGMTGEKKAGRRVRAVSLLALGLIVGIAMTATPASGHVTGSVAHLIKHMKKVFYTKTQSNNRFVNAIPGTDKARQAANADHATSADTATAAGNASAVNGYAASGIVRAARTNTGDTTPIPSGGDVAYGTPLSITAPAAGFVVVNGSISVLNASCPGPCVWWSSIRHIQSDDRSTPIVSAGTDAFEATSASWVFPVSAGVNTFEVRLERNGAETGVLDGWFAEMNALYVPFGPAGGPTITSLRPSSAAVKSPAG